jgi:hypothetical protein
MISAENQTWERVTCLHYLQDAYADVMDLRPDRSTP